MDSQAGHVMTIANSIIGVSILAMPYCFKQCGILLSVLILILSNAISRLSCHLMLKSAVMARRRTFEFLAFHAFGPLGKFITEIGLIGFLLGTCIAYFVVMGDLGPAIISKMTGAKATDTMRTSILMALALFCVLPLGLLRNIDSLNSVSTATIGFYFCLVLKIIIESAPHIFSGDWTSKVELWRPAGILQCLPIFSMALSCQTQIFEIYQTMPTASLEKMNNLIRVAVNICTSVYIFVGIFGYIAFASQTFSGNILMSFSASLVSDVMKIGFVLSLAFSFPLIIFPCRASLYSLLYRRTYALHEGTDKYIPESRFKTLTFIIVLVSLVTGVMIPNIELVLGLVGSTIGIMICVLFPATCFICISIKNTNERILAQIMLFVGVLIMVLGTYANLYAVEELAVTSAPEKVTVHVPDILKLVEEDPALKVIDIPNTTKQPLDWKPDIKQEVIDKEAEPIKEVRHEPPQPEEPAESNGDMDGKKLKVPRDGDKSEQDVKPKDADTDKDSNKLENKQIPENVLQPAEEEQIAITKGVQAPDTRINDDAHVEQAVLNIDKQDAVGAPKNSHVNVPEVPIIVEKHEKQSDPKANGKKGEEVDIEAIKKEEKELFEQEKEKLKEDEKKNLDLMKQMEQQNEDQKKLVEASKKLLEELKQKKKELEENKEENKIEKVKQEKIKAVEQIQEIAEEAIKKLSGDDAENAKALGGLKREENNDKIGAIAKQAIEKISAGDQLQDANVIANKLLAKIADVDEQNKDKIHSQEKPLKEVQYEKVKMDNNVEQQQQPRLPDNINVNSNININSDLKQENANKDNFKLPLNKGNVVPLPIAISNNFTGSYRNLVAPRNDVPKDSILNTEVKDNNNIKQERKSQIESKVEVQQPSDIEAAPKGKEPDQINILNFLKTNAEKVTALNQDKQAKGILHREIRSADGEALRYNDKMEDSLKKTEFEDTRETLSEFRNKENGPDNLKKSEESCDKNEENLGQKAVINELEATEAPVIRMITKLSEPELISIKLPDIDSSILKPMKRDLKSYKFRKRK